jgi:hypothetical protein
MSIKIGDKNNIKKSHIGNNFYNPKPVQKKSFFERHAALSSFIISMVASLILLFPFWGDLVNWIENMFK